MSPSTNDTTGDRVPMLGIWPSSMYVEVFRDSSGKGLESGSLDSLGHMPVGTILRSWVALRQESSWVLALALGFGRL